MKKVLIFLFFIILQSCFLSGQTFEKKIYLDKSLQKKVKPKNSRFYMYRKKLEDGYLLKVYDRKDNLLLNAKNKYKNFKVKEGYYVYFYDSISKRSEGHYKNGKEYGKWIWWYKNGQISEEGEYDINGFKTGLWKGYYENGKKEYEGNYYENKQEGTWVWYREDGSECARISYVNGKVQELIYYDENGIILPGEKVLFKQAEFPGGLDSLNKYVSQNIRYPEKARDKGLEDKVMVFFIVERDGSIGDVIASARKYHEFEEEAERVVRNMPKWIPAEGYNHKIRMPYFLPIEFTLKTYKDGK